VAEIDEPPPARLAFEGRAVELLDLLSAFMAYVQMSLPYAVFDVHAIAPDYDLPESGLQSAFWDKWIAALAARYFVITEGTCPA
jgi:hypothetical protein